MAVDVQRICSVVMTNILKKLTGDRVKICFYCEKKNYYSAQNEEIKPKRKIVTSFLGVPFLEEKWPYEEF